MTQVPEGFKPLSTDAPSEFPDTFKFGKPGDYIRGVITDQRDIQTKYGERHIYTIEAKEGTFHNIINKVVQDEPTALTPGNQYDIFEKGFSMKELRLLPVGTEVFITYSEDGTTKAGDPFKKIDAYSV